MNDEYLQHTSRGFSIFNKKSLTLKFSEFMNYKFKSFFHFPIFCRMNFSILTSELRATFSFGNMLSNHKKLRAHLYLFDPHSSSVVRWRRIKDCRAFYNSILRDFHCHDILRNLENVSRRVSNSSSQLRQSLAWWRQFCVTKSEL